jgi:hypothetical protein
MQRDSHQARGASKLVTVYADALFFSTSDAATRRAPVLCASV